MKYLLSVIIRIAILIPVAMFAFLIGIGIAMGFDSGINLPAALLAIGHLVTFVPVLIVVFLPVKIFSKPPLILKLWFGFSATYLSSLFLMVSYAEMKARPKQIIQKEKPIPYLCMEREQSNDETDNGYIFIYKKDKIYVKKFEIGKQECRYSNEPVTEVELTPFYFTTNEFSKEKSIKIIKDQGPILIEPGKTNYISIKVEENEGALKFSFRPTDKNG
jgi:hypothetical protein